MANNRNNNTGQNTPPSSRSNNVGNKSNQISELDLININADNAKKELSDVFSYVNDNLKSINKTINNDIYNNKKKATSSVKTVFKDLFDSLNKYSNTLDKTLDKFNKLDIGTKSSSVIASASSPNYKNAVYDKAVFNNATFNNSVFNDVVINEKGGSRRSQRPEESQRPRSIGGRDTQNTERRGRRNRYGGSRDRGILNEEFDYEPGDISIPNNKWRMMVNDKRAQLRPIYDKADWLTNHGSLMDTNKLTKILSIKGDIQDIGKTLLNFAKPYWEKAKGAFEQNYTKVAGLTSPEEAGTGGFMGINTGTDIFNDMLDSTVDKYGKAAFSYSGEMVPALTKALEQGFKKPEAILKAQQDMVASKVMPWLDTQSEAWVNMSFNMDKNSLDQIKNQQLILKETESGNRIIQNGIANNLTQDFAPMLTNIDTNLGILSAKDTMGQYYDIMQGWIEQGVAPTQAYTAVKDMMQAQQNPFEAVTSGNVNQILLGAQFAEGATPEQAFGNATQMLLDMESDAVSMGDDIGAGAMNAAYGTDAYLENGWVQTVGKFNQNGTKNKENLKNLNSGSTEQLDNAVKDIANYNTEDQKIQNTLENNAADATQFMKNFPTDSVSELADTAKKIYYSVLSIALTRAAFGGSIGGTGGGIVNALRSGTGGTGITGVVGRFGSGVAGNGTVGLAGKIGAGLGRGGLYAGGASSVTAGLAGLAGGIYGGYRGYQDATAAMKKHKEWGVSKNAAGVGGFFGGDKGSASNALSNAAKWGGIGAAIGTVIPGVGTLIGGAVGAGLGGLMGFIGGDTISQGAQDIGDAVTGNENKWANHATGLSFVPKDNYKANLHKGEMVTTAKTASALRKKGVTGKETIQEQIDNKLNSSIDTSNIESILGTISERVGTVVDNLTSNVEELAVKFESVLDTNLDEDDDKKDK